MNEDCLVTYIEVDVFYCINDEEIMQHFLRIYMKTRYIIIIMSFCMKARNFL